MSEKELLCASLDNTSINKDEENLGNSNPTYGVAEQFPVKNIDQPVGGHSLSENDSHTNSEQADLKAMTASYGAISLEQDLAKTKDSHTSKEVEKASNSDESVVGDSYSSEKLRLKNSNSSSKHFTSSETEDKLGEDNQEDSEQDFDEDVMTGSYGEISLDRELLNCDKNSDSISSKEDERCFLDDVEEVKDNKRPNSLILSASASTSKPVEEFRQQVHQSQQTSGGLTNSLSMSSEEFAFHSAGGVRSGSDTGGLSELQGTLTVDGDVVTFVAEDLAEKIKMSSPISRWTDSSSFAGSRSSTPSLYKQALQPNHHIIDPTILTDLETHAKKVATCVDTMLENLSGTLQSISSLTVDCMETYESSVCKTCDAVDLNIKAVYQLMAKCEELNNSMGPLYCLSSDIKYIKMMLEQLEHIVEHKS